MSIKKLFNSRHIVTKQQSDQIVNEVESMKYVKSQVDKRGKFIPKLDFSDPKFFAHYGSAEKYYEDSIKYIYRTYPYDGSFAEQDKWHYESTYLDSWFFRNEYPKTTGYVQFNKTSNIIQDDGLSGKWTLLEYPQYVEFRGGPHPHFNKPHGSNAPDGQTNSLSEIFSEKNGRANIWNDTEEYNKVIRNSNLYMSGENGNTVEFWLKTDKDPTSQVALFDMWDGDPNTRLTIEHKPFLHGGSKLFQVTFKIKSDGINQVEIGDPTHISSPAKQTIIHPFSRCGWNHYAFVFQNISGGKSGCTLFINGEENDFVEATSFDPPSEALLNLQARLNAYITTPAG